MSICTGRFVKEKGNKKMKSDNRLTEVNLINLNKSSPFFNEKLYTEDESSSVSPRKEIKRFETNKVKNGKIILDNYEKSSFFLDRNKDTVRDTIRDSDIGFEIINDDDDKKNKYENDYSAR